MQCQLYWIRQKHTSVSNNVFTMGHYCFVCYRSFDTFTLLKIINDEYKNDSVTNDGNLFTQSTLSYPVSYNFGNSKYFICHNQDL